MRAKLFDAVLDLKGLDGVLKDRGLGVHGRVQRFVDQEVIRACDDKVPFETGTLKNSALTASAIGAGLVVYATPYAHYMYMGEVYGPNIPIYEAGELAGFFSPKGQAKQPTGRKLAYAGAPQRGDHWFARAMAEHKKDILAGAAALAGGRPEGGDGG